MANAVLSWRGCAGAPGGRQAGVVLEPDAVAGARPAVERLPAAQAGSGATRGPELSPCSVFLHESGRYPCSRRGSGPSVPRPPGSRGRAVESGGEAAERPGVRPAGVPAAAGLGEAARGRRPGARTAWSRRRSAGEPTSARGRDRLPGEADPEARRGHRGCSQPRAGAGVRGPRTSPLFSPPAHPPRGRGPSPTRIAFGRSRLAAVVPVDVIRIR